MNRRRFPVMVQREGGASATLSGQTAWFIGDLKKAGSKGVTKADYPGLHVGDIVMRIRRKLGDDVISTEMEPNTHGWGGEHGRYRLVSEITIQEITYPNKQNTRRQGRHEYT